jgi:hypothetical protein
MTERIYSRQFHAELGAEAWRVLPDGAYAFFGTDSFARPCGSSTRSADWCVRATRPTSTSAATA